MQKKLENFDIHVIRWIRRYGDECARIAFFIIFFWFGILKVFGLSPAQPLVVELFNATFLSNLTSPEIFLVCFGVFEVIIAFLSIMPKLERITFAVMGIHLFTTMLPLFILPETAWAGPLIPTLAGQYIMKNLALLALGMLLLAHIKPMTKTHRILAEEDPDDIL